MHARQRRERVRDVRERPAILQPLDAVVRLHDQIVEGVAVRQQHVEVTILVQVHDLNPGRSPVRMRRGIDGLGTESPMPLVDERGDGFVLLREQRDHVGTSVAIDIGRNRVDGARARIERPALEGRRRAVRRSPLEQQQASCLSPPECRDDEIEIAIAIEVLRFDIRDARQAGSHRRVEEWTERALAAQPDGGPERVIGRQEAAQIGDEKVLDAVAIEIGHRGVRRVRHARETREAVVLHVWTMGEDETVAHVRDDELQAAVAGDVQQRHVRHAWRRSAGRRDRAAVEPGTPLRIRGRPRLGSGERFRRADS